MHPALKIAALAGATFAEVFVTVVVGESFLDVSTESRSRRQPSCQPPARPCR